MGDGSAMRVLVVEDEALLAMDIESVVEDEGHVLVGEAACATTAAALPDRTAPDLALVDLHLANGTSGLVVCEMIRRRWPDAVVVFVTANPQRIPHDFPGAFGVLAKPFSHAGLSASLRYLEEGIHRPPPRAGRPDILTTSAELSKLWA